MFTTPREATTGTKFRIASAMPTTLRLTVSRKWWSTGTTQGSMIANWSTPPTSAPNASATIRSTSRPCALHPSALPHPTSAAIIARFHSTGAT
jgi:hypothetical protein